MQVKVIRVEVQGSPLEDDICLTQCEHQGEPDECNGDPPSCIHHQNILYQLNNHHTTYHADGYW